jgi:hypothetical protein
VGHRHQALIAQHWQSHRVPRAHWSSPADRRWRWI